MRTWPFTRSVKQNPSPVEPAVTATFNTGPGTIPGYTMPQAVSPYFTFMSETYAKYFWKMYGIRYWADGTWMHAVKVLCPKAKVWSKAEAISFRHARFTLSEIFNILDRFGRE